MTVDSCSHPSCDQPITPRRYDGHTYCAEHYRQLILGDLSAEYTKWETGTEPSERLRYLFGRIHEEFGSHAGGSYLTPARIRDRGFGFHKIAGGCEFSITRHLNARSEDRPMTRVVETWRIDLESHQALLLGTRAWTKSDPG